MLPASPYVPWVFKLGSRSNPARCLTPQATPEATLHQGNDLREAENSQFQLLALCECSLGAFTQHLDAIANLAFELYFA